MEFLRAVAEIYLEKAANQGLTDKVDCFSDTVFIFPSRRSAKFFVKYLGEEFTKKYRRALISPRTCTISSLFTDLSGLKETDSIEASIILYQEYIALKKGSRNECEPGNAQSVESYDEFSRWADIVLSDFNDIDKYRIDYKALFANIKDLKELDADYSYLSQAQIDAMRRFWGNFHKESAQDPENEEKSRLDIKKEFTGIWEIMPSLYENFRKRLLDERKASSGIMYSQVAGLCGKDEFGNRLNEVLPAGNYVFIGFNAPNRCEEELFDAIARLGKADFYWDFTGPMVRCEDNKASLYIKRMESKYKSRYPEYKELIGSEYEDCRNINVIAVPGAVQQAAIAGEILEKLAKERNPEEAFDTAIVLPDESLLFPVMNNIPSEYRNINVTMGYPLCLTPLGSFMDLLCALHLGTRQDSWYYKDVFRILEHDYIKNSCTETISRIKSSISDKNLIFIRRKEVLELLAEAPAGEDGELLKSIFRADIEEWTDVAEWHKEVLRKLDAVSDRLSRDFIAQYFTAIERILSYKGLEDINVRTFYKLESQLTAKLTVPFEGEPLKGLQVVGPLEIRSLDFRNLIILNVNESVFPKTAASNSFIPFNLRKGFGLPTYEQADAIAAYHFYRSIYRCENIWLLYDTRTEGMKNGEVSRFVKQLKYHHNVKLNEFTTQNPIMSSKDGSEIKVEKNPRIMAELDRFRKKDNRKFISASSLKTYLSCPLKFYLNNVEGLKEEQEVDEDIAANIFGNLYHNSMQKMYEPYLGRQVTEKDLSEMSRSLKDERSGIHKDIEQIFAANKLGQIKGQNIIVYEVLLKYLELTLERDKAFAPFTYRYSEKDWYPEFNGVNLIAFIDRTDIVQDMLRISDYKTGNVEDIDAKDARNLPFSLFPAPGEDFKYKTWFQLYFYAMVMQLEKQIDNDVNVAVYQVGKLSEDGVKIRNVSKEEIGNFRMKLSETLENLFNPEIPFTQAPQGAKICGWCPFRSICKR